MLQGQRGHWTLKQQHKHTYQQLHESSSVTQALSVHVRTAALGELRDAVCVCSSECMALKSHGPFGLEKMRVCMLMYVSLML